MKIFKNKSILSIFTITVTNIIFALVYLVSCNEIGDWEGMDNNEDTLSNRFFNRLYFSFSITSTVGPGKIIATSFKSKLMLMIHYLIISSEILMFLTK